MTAVVGIDLGTTFSLIAVVECGKPRIIANGQDRLLPSVVGFTPDGELLVGVAARNQLIVEPGNTIKSIKRKMGTDERVNLAGKEYTPAEISACILRTLKETAERELGGPIPKAVITVPAYFGDAARQATKEAGEIAGFEVARIINEPTAAALAYGLNREDDIKVAVYDLGGGTFDVSIVEMNNGVIDVRASHGNTHLGGDDFDEVLANHVAGLFEEEHGIDLRQDRRAYARLLRAAEQAKIVLSDAPYARLTEEFISRSDKGVPLHLDVEISREDFEELIGELVRSTLESVDRAMADAGLRRKDLQRVLLVGGSTRIPLVRKMLAGHLGIQPLGDINPDEAVALGAAVQAAIVAGEPIEAILVDVAPHSLGIETARYVLDQVLSDRYTVVLPRNSAIPSSKAESFFTLSPDQDEAQIKVYQGDDPVASRNRLLGEFLFKGIAPNPLGRSREVIVRFDYDINGIVQVSATDRQTNRSEGITITASRPRPGDHEKSESMRKLAPVNRRVDREIETVLRRAERLMTVLEARGDTVIAEQIHEAAGELERAREQRDYTVARVVMESLGELLYGQEP